MSDTPIHNFFVSMANFHPNDIAVLFGLVAAQELSGDIISPSVERRLWSVELEPHDLQESMHRLEDAGEVRRVLAPRTEESGGGVILRGFKVVRFEQLQNLMTDFGRRRYNRLKQDKHRQKEVSCE